MSLVLRREFWVANLSPIQKIIFCIGVINYFISALVNNRASTVGEELVVGRW